MALTLLHTADWQIGKPFNDFEGDTGAALREARFDAVKRLAALATERGADAVLVAGDVFDTASVRDDTVHRVLHALGGFRGPWVLLPGNHDAAQAGGIWERVRNFAPAENVIVADARNPIVLANGRLAVLPAPLVRRHEVEDLTEWWDEAETPAGAVRMGLAHGSVTNRLPEAAESPNPIADDRAERARLAYLALGDWHGTLEIAPRTWYAGTPEPDRFKDNDSGNALIVTIESADAAPRVERVRIARYRWRQVAHTLLADGDLEGLDAALKGLDAPFDSHVVALALEGTLGLAAWERLDALLARWSGQLRALRCDRTKLVAEPSADDLDAIDQSGFVRAAIDELQKRAHDPADAEATSARDALRLMYALHRQAAGR